MAARAAIRRLLRARLAESHSGYAESGAGFAALLSRNAIGPVESSLRAARGIFLLLRHGAGKFLETWRGLLFSRRAVVVGEPVLRFRGELEGKGGGHPAGNAFPRTSRNAPGDSDEIARGSWFESADSLLGRRRQHNDQWQTLPAE